MKRRPAFERCRADFSTVNLEHGICTDTIADLDRTVFIDQELIGAIVFDSANSTIAIQICGEQGLDVVQSGFLQIVRRLICAGDVSVCQTA